MVDFNHFVPLVNEISKTLGKHYSYVYYKNDLLKHKIWYLVWKLIFHILVLSIESRDPNFTLLGDHQMSLPKDFPTKIVCIEFAPSHFWNEILWIKICIAFWDAWHSSNTYSEHLCVLRRRIKDFLWQISSALFLFYTWIYTSNKKTVWPLRYVMRFKLIKLSLRLPSTSTNAVWFVICANCCATVRSLQKKLVLALDFVTKKFWFKDMTYIVSLQPNKEPCQHQSWIAWTC